MIIYLSIRRDEESLRAKHTGQRSVVGGSVLRHLAGVGQVGELISSGIGLVHDALSSGAGRTVNEVYLVF